MHKILFLRNVWKSKANEWIRENKFDTITELFENYSKCRIWMFQFWHFPPTFVLKMTCLVTLFGFQKLVKIDHFWHSYWTFVHSKCTGTRSSLRSQCQMRLFCVIFKHHETIEYLRLSGICLKVEFEKWCVLSGFDRLKRLDFSDSLLSVIWLQRCICVLFCDDVI